MQIAEDVRPYKYQETVFVEGDLARYLDDLERYFRISARDVQNAIRCRQRSLRYLDSCIRVYEGTDHESVFFDWMRLDCPFDVNGNNYQQARTWSKERLDFLRKLHSAQRANHGRLMGVIEDGKGIDTLDLTNYAYPGRVVRITFDSSYENGSIRMRVFYEEDTDNYRDYASGFAQHANRLEGVKASCDRESSVTEEPCPIGIFLRAAKVRRNRLRVAEPEFEISHRNGRVRYSVHLGETEKEMLELCGDSYHNPENLCYESRSWSPNQGGSIIRNLFGILGIEIRNGARSDWYSKVFVPSENERATRRALNDGSFTKSVSIECLPVLSALYERTTELREKHGTRFYPRFTVREAARRSMMSMAQTRRYLDHLTGVLAVVYDREQRKWLIPRSRLSLARNILENAGS